MVAFRFQLLAVMMLIVCCFAWSQEVAGLLSPDDARYLVSRTDQVQKRAAVRGKPTLAVTLDAPREKAYVSVYDACPWRVPGTSGGSGGNFEVDLRTGRIGSPTLDQDDVIHEPEIVEAARERLAASQRRRLSPEDIRCLVRSSETFRSVESALCPDVRVRASLNGVFSVVIASACRKQSAFSLVENLFADSSSGILYGRDGAMYEGPDYEKLRRAMFNREEAPALSALQARRLAGLAEPVRTALAGNTCARLTAEPSGRSVGEYSFIVQAMCPGQAQGVELVNVTVNRFDGTVSDTCSGREYRSAELESARSALLSQAKAEIEAQRKYVVSQCGQGPER